MRLRRTPPWWWYRDVWDNYVGTQRVHVDITVKIYRTLPIIIFYEVGLFWGNRFLPVLGAFFEK